MNINVKLYSNSSPYQWQKKCHEYISNLELGSYKIITIKAARQLYGKTTFAKNEIIRFSLKNNNANIAYIAPTLKLSSKMFSELNKMFQNNGLVKSSNASSYKIVLENGSEINFLSAEQRDAMRGLNVRTLLIIDECAFIQDDVYYEIISPFILVHKPVVILISTPRFKRGFFYEFYEKGLKNDNEIYKTFDWADDYPFEDNEFMLSLKAKMPLRKYLCEYKGQWLSNDSSMFNYENCIYDSNLKIDTKEVVCGIDFGTGSGKDSTVLTFINQDGYVVKILSNNDLTPSQSVELIKNEINGMKNRGLNVKKILVEENSIGKIYYSMLLDAGVNIFKFLTTNESKRKIIENLQVAFEQCKLFIPNNLTLFDQLNFYEPKMTINGNVVYNAHAGENDDMVMSLAIALEAYNQMNVKYIY